MSLDGHQCVLNIFFQMQSIVATSERLLIRHMTHDDFASLLEIMSDSHTMRFYPSAYSPAQVENWINRCMRSYKDHGFGLWVLQCSDTGQFLGQCGISLQSIRDTEVPEVGYHLNKAFWGQGYATEAARVCLQLGFEQFGLDEIFIHTYERNIPSRRVAERLGMAHRFTYQKKLRGFEIVWPHTVYSMTRIEYWDPNITAIKPDADNIK